ncbi:MAG: hypothetical protein AAF928_07120 [Myxococcota bacterium]
MDEAARRTWLALAINCIVGTTGACDPEPRTEPPSAPTTATRDEARRTTATSSTEGPRLADDVVALAKEIVQKCATAVRGGNPARCPGYLRWTQGEMFADGKNDLTLVHLAEDPDGEVRRLAAETLEAHGVRYRTDPALARRLVAALKKEKEAPVAAPLASAVADIALEPLALTDEVLALVDGHPLAEVGHRLVRDVLFRNRTSEAVYAFVLRAAEEHRDPEVRRHALRGFWTGTPRGRDAEVCALWRRIGTTDEDAEVAAKAIELAFQKVSGRCEAEYGVLLTRVASLARKGEVRSVSIAFGLQYLHRQPDLDAGPARRALQAAKALVANPDNDGLARSWALRFLGETEPDAATLAARHLSDDDARVKRTAREIRDGKIKPAKN